MFLNEATLREAAFQLLASSTAKRYIREAQRITTECGLADTLRNDPDQAAQAQRRSHELLAQIGGKPERSPAEFEVALLLCALARIGSEGVAKLLRDASQTPSAWIRALADRLYELGPPTSDKLRELKLQLESMFAGEVENPFPLRASDRRDRAGFPRVA